MILALPETGWFTPIIAKWVTVLGILAVIFGLTRTVKNENRLRQEAVIIDTKLEHFDKLKEAIIDLQGSSEEEINKGIKIIEGERVYLDDSELQNYLDSFLNAVEECRRYGVAISNIQINPIISWLAKRRNKRG